MRKKLLSSILIGFFILFLAPVMAAADNPLIYDYANVLSDSEEAKLEEFAREYAEKWETDFILLTTNDLEGKAIEDFQGDFHDEQKLGYAQPLGNVAMLTIYFGEPKNELFLSGYEKAETYLSDNRLDKIRDKLIPILKDGDYAQAYRLFVQDADKYMKSRPEFYFQTWFHFIAAIVVGAIVVGSMLIKIGGKVTVNERTYMDAKNSRVVSRRDDYLRKTVTRRKKPSNKSGGGGGITRGGSSYSGSKGSF